MEVREKVQEYKTRDEKAWLALGTSAGGTGDKGGAPAPPRAQHRKEENWF